MAGRTRVLEPQLWGVLLILKSMWPPEAISACVMIGASSWRPLTVTLFT